MIFSCSGGASAKAEAGHRILRLQCQAARCRIPRARQHTGDLELDAQPARERSGGIALVISRPATAMVPAVGNSAPATHLSSVVLPEPLGPIRPWNDRSRTMRSALSSAVSAP